MQPIAFRIKDFRSIRDSGICPLSGDGITVLAGQNESGKTAVLSALRDFDIMPTEPPMTPEFLPEGDDEAEPQVAIQFSVEPDELAKLYLQSGMLAPPQFAGFIETATTIWITRDLTTNHFRFDPEIIAMWEGFDEDATSPEGESESNDDTPLEEGASAEEQQLKPASAEAHADELYTSWPIFVYFDSFSDALPRATVVSTLVARKGVPQIVIDFLELAEIDPNRLIQLSTDPKQLGNYLSRRNAVITGDFLTYWKQRTGGTNAVELHARSFRDEEGTLNLAFFVRDRVDQYPDQRSKGFLWFLSFYLRLAAAHKKVPNSTRILLVDEPGSYLHARAQRDILHLFEDRLAAGGQRIIYTTHSPYLLPAASLYRVRLVVKDPSKGTLVLDRLTHPALRGDEFADTLSPVLTSIGIDIQGALSFVRPKNLLVEGITDYLYLTRWATEFNPDIAEQINIFPCFGAGTIHTLASLLLGWGLQFAVLVDRDTAGTRAKDRLHRDLLIPPERIVQPKDAVAIEDVFSAEDFRKVLLALDPNFTLLPEERPSTAIERQKIDKVLLARRFSELHADGMEFTGKTRNAIQRLLKDIVTAVEHPG
ncbi:MAG TPA: AAA family ATPase [Longimicrobium sp.]|jgi:hypothetical protein